MDSISPHARIGRPSPYNAPPLGTSGVYTITNTVNGKQYIGSSHDIQIRWQQHRTHLRKNAHHSLYLQRAWNKYGENAFIFEIIEYTLPGTCILREQYWMDKRKPAYNILSQAGSPFGYRASEETRAKLSQIAKMRKPPMLGRHHTEASKIKMAQTRRERAIPAPNKGKSPSEETKARQSVAKVDKKLSKAHCEAIRKAQVGKPLPPAFALQSERNRGVKHTPGRIARNSASHMGQIAWNKGLKKEKPLCLVENCSSPCHAKKMCKRHYQNQKRMSDRSAK